MFGKTKAFTLIELLIVVAIIAILAAIAVPNFLEAQTRSKVARVKSDIRSLVVALEAYGVDHNKYLKEGTTAPGWASHTWLRMEWKDGVSRPQFGQYDGAPLTTPIAYITSVPFDPFTSVFWEQQQASAWTWPSLPRNTSCMYTYGNKWDWVKGIYGGPNSNFPVIYPNPGFALYSAGPNNSLDWPPIVYDPTNGTISKGNIHYVRGAGFIPLTGME